MESVPTVDIGTILKPISEEKPCGVDPREGASFDLLKEARREEDAGSQGVWQRQVKVADWTKVIQLATKILSTEGKELQVAVWLAEGLVKKHGPAGLRDGLKILCGLHEQYWDSFFPLIENGDMEYRSGRVEALDKILPIAIFNMPLIHPSEGPVYSCWQYKESQEVENLRRGGAADAEKKRQLAAALEEGKPSGDAFDKAVAMIPLAQCSAILENLDQCWEELERFERILDETYRPEAPSLRNIKEALGECRSLIQEIVQKKGGARSPVPRQPDSTPREDEAAPASRTAASGSGMMPADREDALRRLGAIAEFFHRTEPHSPVAYLVERAARWGQMPLDEWLQEVIKNLGVLGEVRETLGIKSDKK